MAARGGRQALFVRLEQLLEDLVVAVLGGGEELLGAALGLEDRALGAAGCMVSWGGEGRGVRERARPSMRGLPASLYLNIIHYIHPLLPHKKLTHVVSEEGLHPRGVQVHPDLRPVRLSHHHTVPLKRRAHEPPTVPVKPQLPLRGVGVVVRAGPVALPQALVKLHVGHLGEGAPGGLGARRAAGQDLGRDEVEDVLDGLAVGVLALELEVGVEVGDGGALLLDALQVGPGELGVGLGRGGGASGGGGTASSSLRRGRRWGVLEAIF